MLTPSTKLDAVNSLLTAVGEYPVSNLVDDIAEAQIAIQVLDEVSREVQSRGWSWNTRRKNTLTPNNDSNVVIPANVTRVNAVDVNGWEDRTKRYTIRNNKLYDMIEFSDIFETPVYADMVYLWDFENLPEEARRFITLDAQQRYMNRVAGADADMAQVQQQATRAYIALEQDEDAIADRNILWDNPLSNYISSRHHGGY
jgi:hypothetical protein